MTSSHCGICGRQYSECVCGPVERSAEILAARIEAERARIAALERVAEAAREWFAGGSQGSYSLRKALQDLDEAPGGKERGT